MHSSSCNLLEITKISIRGDVMNPMIEKPVIKQLTSVVDIYKTIVLFDSDFVPSLTERGLDLNEYAQILYELAEVYSLYYENIESGFVAFYANDTVHQMAYLTQIAVKSQFINRGFGYTLLKMAIDISREKGMKTMKLEVYNHNHSAIAFYKRNGFTNSNCESNEFCHMQRDL